MREWLPMLTLLPTTVPLAYVDCVSYDTRSPILAPLSIQLPWPIRQPAPTRAPRIQLTYSPYWLGVEGTGLDSEAGTGGMVEGECSRPAAS
jgi:hypothetical protein